MIKLYHDPISTTSRPVLLCLAEHDLPVEKIVVSLMNGEQKRDAYKAINPNQAVPTLVDDDLAIGEGSAILKYLADLAGSSAYPLDLKARARIDAMMDWFNTGFAKDFHAHHCYPQMFPHHRFESPAVQSAVVKRGLQNSRRWLSILNDHYLAHGGPYLLGRELTIADYLGAGYVSVGEAVDFDLSPWPRVAAWLERMRARPAWLEVFAPFYGMVASLRVIRREAVWTPMGLAAFAGTRRFASKAA